MPEALLGTEDAALAQSLREPFAAAGIRLRQVSGLAALADASRAAPPQIVIADLDGGPRPPWPAVAGLREALAALRVPIVAVSADYTSPPNVIAGLRAGAVEYLAKPVDPRVLTARVLALISAMERRRRAPAASGLLRTADGAFQLDLKAHRFLVREGENPREIALSPREYSVLTVLLGRAGELVTKEDLAGALWAGQTGQEQANLTIAQFISHIRKKLGRAGARIKTVWGMGYRLE